MDILRTLGGIVALFGLRCLKHHENKRTSCGITDDAVLSTSINRIKALKCHRKIFIMRAIDAAQGIMRTYALCFTMLPAKTY